MSQELFTATLAMVGLVIVVSTLMSGVIEKTGLPHVAVFLVLGAALGPFGLRLLDAHIQSPLLQIVATLSLALVLFTDAIGLDTSELKRHAGLALRVLGPGTVVSAAVVGVLAWWLLDLRPAEAAILGAALASTDPVLLRGLTRRTDINAAVRLALRLESGLNDVVLLPIVVVAMAFLSMGPTLLGQTLLSVTILGPIAEQHFRRALAIGEGSPLIFFTRPLSCALLVVAVVLLIIPFVVRRRVAPLA